jgi:hypothetical protein
MDFKRLLVPDGGFKRVFSIVRFIALMAGAGIASVYFMTGGSFIAAALFAFVTYVLFRYGQIKGYLK